MIDPDIEISNEQDHPVPRVSPDPDVMEPCTVAEGHPAVPVDTVPADPVLGGDLETVRWSRFGPVYAFAGVGVRGLGAGGGGCRSARTGPDLLGARGCPGRVAAWPGTLQCLVEPFDLPAGLGVVGPGPK